MALIEASSLTKRFGKHIAVDAVDLKVEEGEIFSLLGPDGAGKTTLVSMLSTVLKVTEGTAIVCGHDIREERDSVRKCIGIVFQDQSLEDELTGRENLRNHAQLYGVPREEGEKRIEELFFLMQLSEKADQQLRTWPMEMKRRLESARGLLHEPHLLILDEPSAGLDPQTRRNLWDYIKRFNKKENVTVLLATQYAEEADFLSDRIGIIDNGKIIMVGTPDKLKGSLGVLTIETSEPEKLQNCLEGDYIKAIHLEKSLQLTVANASKSIATIVEKASKEGIEVGSVQFKRPSLEDVFMHHTGKEQSR